MALSSLLSADWVYILKMLGTSFLIVEALMILLWIIYLLNRRVSIVDFGWSLSFILIAAIYFIMGDGDIWRKILMLTVVSIWALRLTYHLVRRFNAEGEDPRYMLLLNAWNAPDVQVKALNLRVLSLFLLQGFIAVVLSLPFALISNNTFSYFEPLEVLGLLVWGLGIVGESIADTQLYQFKQQMGQNQVLQTGLWKYSRHPNYFFEWIVWIGYAIMALSSPGGIVALLSPIFMLYLLLKVSGVPLAEAEALRTKGDAYRDYQARTNLFFPCCQKKSKS